MARKVVKKDSRYLAKLVTEDRAPCAFCHREVDDEVTYGKLYAIGDIQCHYFCALLSCCLVQRGPEDEGLFGFTYRDIRAELERSKKHKCSYCGRCGANLGCSVGSCRKQFHLPCGRERNAVSLFYGSYKSFCQTHAPKQKIPDHIMSKAKLRMKDDKKNIVKQNGDNIMEQEMVCVICYESVKAHPAVDTFWPPCCARDAWFHRTCLQRMALSAGMHYLKCPLCNDKTQFYEAVIGQGYYVPDRDAAWELEQNAFAEIYERPLSCSAETCQCPMGRGHDADQGMWDIKLCLLCGSVGSHAQCMGASETARYVCLTCTPAAPENMQALADTIEKLIIQEQASAANSHGPVMPSRMSLRRTKGRLAYMNRPSTSTAIDNIKTENQSPAPSPNTQSSRQELNLKSPRKLMQTDSYKSNVFKRESYKSPEKTLSPRQKDINSSKTEAISPKLTESYKNSESHKISLKHSDSYKLEARLLSPMKLLEQRFREKVVCMGGTAILDDEEIVGLLRNRFKKPRPLSEKKKIVDEILDGLFSNSNNLLKCKEPVREWCSPRKCYQIPEEEEKQATSDNQSKDSENTVEKENSIHETPKKTRIGQQSTPNKNDKVNIVNEDNEKQENNSLNIDDDSSNSTFQLPSEFIADDLSDDSTFPSPKCKTIEMKDSSLEISEKDQSVNIDVVKTNDSDVSNKICSFKFSRLDKEKLEKENVGIDMESFKKGYLSEVDRNQKDFNVRNVIDFAIDAHFQGDQVKRKRKMSEGNLVLKYNKNEAKRRKMSENDLEASNSSNDFEVKNVFNSTKKEKLDKTDKNKRQKKDKNSKKRERERQRHCNKNKDTLQRVHNKQSNSEENKIKEESNLLDRRQELKAKRINALKKEVIEKRLGDEKKKLNEKDLLHRKQDKVKAEKSIKGEIHVDKPKENKEKNAEDRKENRNKSKKESMIKSYDEGNILKEKRKEKHKKSVKRDKNLKNKNSDKYEDKKHKRNPDKHSKGRQINKNIEVTIDSTENKLKQKTETKLSISNNEKDISVKIKWKKKQLRLKIESKKDKTERIEKDSSKFKQYVLQYFSEVTPKEVLVKPEKEVSPLKRKYVKQEKTPDNLKQMSIQNFFKAKSPKE